MARQHCLKQISESPDKISEPSGKTDEPSDKISESPGKTSESSWPIILHAFVQFVFSTLILSGLLFWAAGTLAWTRGWLHLGVWGVIMTVNFMVLLRTNRAVLVARLKWQRISEKFDMIIMFLSLLATLAIPIVAGLDAVRYQVSHLPRWAIYPGILLHMAGDAFMLWAMIVNPYLERTVRIQTERDHHVITTGPYSFIRHPMYVGGILLLFGIPLILESWWAFFPVGVMALILVVRIVFEDRMLRSKLPGYEDYARQIRYRLLPGIW